MVIGDMGNGDYMDLIPPSLQHDHCCVREELMIKQF